jgi:hypothetical protein
MTETRTKPPRKRAPGGGRKPLPAGESKADHLKVYLTDDLLAYALSKGGSRWVRDWIQARYRESLIV